MLNSEEKKRIEDFVMTHTLSRGLGTESEPCSIAAINYALSGNLSDVIPACMSPLIGRWIIEIQDSMPDAIRNSDEWRKLLPSAAGTTAPLEVERERSQILLHWYFDCMEFCQGAANELGEEFGYQWSLAIQERNAKPLLTYANIGYAQSKAHYETSLSYQYRQACYIAKSPIRHYREDGVINKYIGWVGQNLAMGISNMLTMVKRSKSITLLDDKVEAFWRKVDPAGTLSKLIDVGQEKNENE